LLSTIKRLSRNAKDFKDHTLLSANYAALEKKHIKDDMLVTVEHSDIVKPCGEQFEALSSVHDSSKGGIEKGI